MAVWLMAAPRDSAPPLTRGFGFFCKRLGAACSSTIRFHQWLCTALSMVFSASIMGFGSDFLGKNVVAALPRSKGGFASHKSGHCRPRRARPEYGFSVPARRVEKRLRLYRRPDLPCPRHRHERILRHLAARSGVRFRAASPRKQKPPHPARSPAEVPENAPHHHPCPARHRCALCARSSD